MELVLKDIHSTFTVSDAIFGCAFNKALVHQVVVAYAAGSRQGTCAQKTRAAVSGSGKKPWRQKGTGRARSGSLKSPIWRSGGVTFAGITQNYRQKINKKMYRGALRSILSELVRQERLVIVENFSIEKPKTKLLVQKLRHMALKNVFIVTDELDRNLFLAARNLHRVNVCDISNINPISLIGFNKIVMTIDVVKKIETVLT